eukprot:c3386_g1_i2 orf=38-355(-)
MLSTAITLDTIGAACRLPLSLPILRQPLQHRCPSADLHNHQASNSQQQYALCSPTKASGEISSHLEPALTLLHADLQAPKQPQTSRGHTPIAPYHVALTLHISIG